MPKSWSNREIEHIDLRTRGKGRMPFAGWMIIGMGIVALGVVTFLAINICLHPVETPVNMSAPASRTR
jgi:hypothetical protein